MVHVRIEERDRIPLKITIGNTYTLSWAKPGTVWVLKGIGSEGAVEMETPKTKRRLIAKAHELRLTDEDALKRALSRK